MSMRIETVNQDTIYSEDIERLEIKQIDAPTRDANITVQGYIPIAIMKDKCIAKPVHSGQRIELEKWTYSKCQAEACIAFIRQCEERRFADVSIYLRSRLFNTEKITTWEEYEIAVDHKMKFDRNLAKSRKINFNKQLGCELTEHLVGYEVSQDSSKGATTSIGTSKLIDPSDPLSGPLCEVCCHYHALGGHHYD